MVQFIETSCNLNFKFSTLSKICTYFVYNGQLHYTLFRNGIKSWYNFETFKFGSRDLELILSVTRIEFKLKFNQSDDVSVETRLFSDFANGDYFILPRTGNVCQKMNDSEYFDIKNHQSHRQIQDTHFIPCEFNIKAFVE